MKQVIDHLSHSAARDYAKVLTSHRTQKVGLVFPENEYFSDQGLELFAIELLSQLQNNPATIRIAFSPNQNQYTINESHANTVTISLPMKYKSLLHVRLYITSRAIMHHYINVLFPNIQFKDDALHTLINSVLIKNGLGVIALNASEEITSQRTSQDDKLTFSLLYHQNTLQKSVREFCRQHRIKLSRLSPYLLVDVFTPDKTGTAYGTNKAYVDLYRQQKSKREKFKKVKYVTIVLCSIALIISVYFLTTASTLTNEQAQNIHAARRDVTTCIRELEKMREAVGVQDIYTLQSITSKQKECESLRQDYNTLIDTMNR